MKQALVVCGDIDLLKSALMNLVSNAIKFTTQGAILVSVRPRGNGVLFQVWDTGVGIPDEYLHQIFEEFYQVNNPQRDRTRGLGLGLSIAKRALALFDGEITCRSRVGRGSVFEFHLPYCDKSSASLQPEIFPAVSRENFAHADFAAGKRFVVVEDDALVAEALSKALKGLGASVEFFHRADVALSHPCVETADYFIVDFMLGGSLNGVQFLEKLREKLGSSVNAVIMTGDTSAAFVREKEKYDWTVLHKPVNVSKLISALSAGEL
jgi:CheY-like chemotaxis protein/anti-sigma regulatory factor (Ser/Thr protein kinase)